MLVLMNCFLHLSSLFLHLPKLSFVLSYLLVCVKFCKLIYLLFMGLHHFYHSKEKRKWKRTRRRPPTRGKYYNKIKDNPCTDKTFEMKIYIWCHELNSDRHFNINFINTITTTSSSFQPKKHQINDFFFTSID